MTRYLYQRANRVILFEDGRPLKEMEDGVIIVCKVCKRSELVKRKSLCDVWKLCVKHAREKFRQVLSERRRRVL